MAEEMNAHLEQRILENISAGLTPEEARFAALQKFGSVLQIQEQCRDERGWLLTERIGRDVGYAIRSLRKSPGFTTVALVTLGLGIGANTAIFSLVKSVLLRPLPYPHPEQLVAIWQKQRTVDVASFSWPDFQDYRQQNRSFTALAGYRVVTYALTGDGDPEQFTAAQVSADLFPVIGLAPQVGRFFTPAEDKAGAPGSVVLTDALWRRRFGADPHVVGRTFRLDQVPFTVIGVLPPEFTTPANVDFLTPLGRASLNPGWQLRSMRPGIFAVGRLKPGVFWQQAQEDLSRISSLLERDHPETDGAVTVSGQPLFDQTVGGYRQGLWLLFGAVAFVLLIACANLANLLLVRGAYREAEIAVRSALGTSRGRIVSQCLAECLLVAFGGGLLGLLLTSAGRRGIAALSPAGVARFQQAEIDVAVLAAAFGFCVLTALLFGGWPAWRMAQTDLRTAMEGAGRAASTGPGLTRTRETLIIGEVAITLMLLVGAGLLLKSFGREQAVNLGFRTRGIPTARVKIPFLIYDTQAKARHFDDRLLALLGALPGVDAAALAASMPLAPLGRYSSYCVDGLRQSSEGQTPAAELNVVSDGYFDTLGISVLRGRPFGFQETLDSTRVAIVDHTFAHRYWGEQEAIGKTIRLGGEPLHTIATLPRSAGNNAPKPPIASEDHFAIIGIVPPVRLYGYAVEPQLPQIYISNRQIPLNTFLLLVQGRGDAAALVGAVRKAVHQIDANQPISEVGTLDGRVNATFAASRLYTFLLMIFAGLALLLASVGLYGVLAYQVSRRQREFAIRLAIGGVASQIASLVLRRGLRLIGIGSAIGMLGALALGRLFSSLLYRTSMFDTGVIAGVSGLLFIVALLASWFPSRRAARVAPSEALRVQ
jgi:putative ABC transport system permease protein